MRIRLQGMISWCGPLALALLLLRPAAAQSSHTHLVFTTQPSTTAAAAPINPPIQIMVLDNAGKTLTTFGGRITVAITDGTGNEDAELRGTASVAAVAGVATFADLRIDAAAAAYTLTASATGLESTTSTAFAITRPG